MFYCFPSFFSFPLSFILPVKCLKVSVDACFVSLQAPARWAGFDHCLNIWVFWFFPCICTCYITLALTGWAQWQPVTGFSLHVLFVAVTPISAKWNTKSYLRAMRICSNIKRNISGAAFFCYLVLVANVKFSFPKTWIFLL